MPTYDYECEGCQHTFEAFQSITAAVLTECPQCKQAKLHRLIGTGGGLIFKGTGFYCTDYKSTGKKLDESVDRAKKASKDVKESCNGSGACASPASNGSCAAPGN